MLIVQDILLLVENHIQHILSIVFKSHHSPFWWENWSIYTIPKKILKWEIL